jgi:hypothetical protein
MSITAPHEAPMSTFGPVMAGTIYPNESVFKQGVFRWQIDFTLNSIGGTQGLVSRDQTGTDEAGHLSAWMKGDQLVVRHQDISGGHSSVTLTSTTLFTINRLYKVTISIGPTGFAMFIGQFLDKYDTWSVGTTGNDLPLVLGALCTQCTPDFSVGPSRPINGTIILRIFDNEADWIPLPPITGDNNLSWVHPTQWDDGENTPLAAGELDYTTIYSCAGIELTRVPYPEDAFQYLDQPAGEYCYYATSTAIDSQGHILESDPSNQARKTIE